MGWRVSRPVNIQTGSAASSLSARASHNAIMLFCMALGAIHLLNGLYDAELDHVPVVAIVGQTARSAMGGSFQQEVGIQSLRKRRRQRVPRRHIHAGP